ncbi:uncharacterized protein G2W53_001784 [Senna tora]|uniref:Uncharacterized protein n=1 Tax=Senna tora TaxID=362788 RepID=A0A834XIE2_9FABA|nr:uncharacterized protein G2W53_001784 [Senna tora]
MDSETEIDAAMDGLAKLER